MSKERDLLESCLDEMQYHSIECPELTIEIKELLAQPEPFTPDWGNYRQGVEDAKRKPLSAKDIGKKFLQIDVWHRYECFIAGVRWAEEQHSITGVDDKH